MTPEHAQKLLSGYATGSLSEAEQQQLYAAALENQELFDQLAEEQALKELIELPGARARLVAALEPVRQPKRVVWWPWAAVAGGLAAVTVFVLIPGSKEERATVAQAPVEISAPVVQPRVADVPVPQPAPKKEAAPKASAITAPPPAVKPKPEAVTLADAGPAPQSPAQVFVTNGTIGGVTTPLLKSEQSTVLLAQEKGQAADQGPVVPAPEAERARADAAAPAAPAFAAGRGKGGAGGGGFGGGRIAANIAASPAQTAFKHEFLANGRLQVTPATAGTLRVTAGEQEMFARNPVVAATPIVLPVPEGATEIRMEFVAGNAPPVIVIVPVPAR